LNKKNLKAGPWRSQNLETYRFSWKCHR